MRIDLNCDMGEGFGRWRLGNDEEIARYITSANLACGFHAGDPLVMEATLKLCVKHQVGPGAHPGYPDLRGFGRRPLRATPEEVRGDVLYQLGALGAIARAVGVRLTHVKPHGALYNTAAGDAQTARAICEAVVSYDPGLVVVTLAGPAGESFRAQAREMGLKVAAEAFADRAYTPEGRLVPRTEPGAVIHDEQEVVARCVQMAVKGTVTAVDGTEVELNPHTICVHGDTPGAVALARAIRAALEAEGVKLMHLVEVV